MIAETALIAFTTFFATVGPIESAAFFAALTPQMDSADRRAASIKAAGLATVILLAFALFGEFVLNVLGVSLAALRSAGGVVLFLIAMDMIFARQSGGIAMSMRETREAEHKADITVFPLATPILAGPGAMSGAVLLTANAQDDFILRAVVIVALLAVMAATLGILLVAVRLHDVMGVTAQKVIMRVFGILLAALAMQSVFDGVSEGITLATAG